jgi:flagellar FliL protein
MSTEVEEKKDDATAAPAAEGAEGAKGAEGEQKEKGKLKGKRLLIIIIGIVVLLSIPGVLYFTGVIGGKKKVEPKNEIKKTEAIPQDIFLDLDEFLVNLDRGDRQPSFLKMSVTLQLANQEAVQQINAKLPLIRDGFQVYLRELRADDLQGSGGIYRLREELLLRINKVMYPTKVNDILFKEILVQ